MKRVLSIAAFVALAGCGPREPADALSDVEAVTGSAETPCARKKDGTVLCWGHPYVSGDHNVRGFPSPTRVGSIRAVAASDSQWCLVFNDGKASCSEASFGLSGKAWERVPGWTGTYYPAPMAYVPITDVAQVGAGTYIDCARRTNGSVLCWGDYAEVLATGKWDRSRRSNVPFPGASNPVEVKGIPPIADLTLGSDNALAIGTDGSGWMLGGLDRGVVRVAGIDDAVQAASGGAFHCVRRKSGAVSCWRYDSGIDALKSVGTTPQPVAGAEHAKSIAAGPYGACAVLEDGRATCWGDYVSLSTAKTTTWLKATPVPNAEHLTSLMVGGNYACGLVENGRVLCWGNEEYVGIGGVDFDQKAGRKMSYVRTGTADSNKLRERSVLIAILAAAGFALSLIAARFAERAAMNTWRRLPATPLAAGAGYRAAEIPMTRTHAPALLRVAIFLGLGSVGADMAYVAMAGLYAYVAIDLGLRQRHDMFSAVMNLATSLAILVMLGWLTLVALAIFRAARGSEKALRRWRIVGILGAITHGLLALSVMGNKNFLPALIVPHDVDAWSHRSESAPAYFALLGASVLGAGASIVLAIAARHRRDLAPK